jgi:putative heme-binding domain-containing protein
MFMHNLSVRFTIVGPLIASLTVLLSAQAPTTSNDERRNPFAGNPEAIRQGAVLFRQECVFCHGVGARGGVRGPDVTTGSWSHGGSDADLSRTISNGVPGTAMPAHQLTDDEIWQIVSYLRTQEQPPASSVGDARRGETLFFEGGKCSRCHIVNGRGGRLGPELSYIGSARPRAYLITSIREPGRHIAENRSFGGFATLKYDTIAAVTRDGKAIVGVPMNEDTFTVQVMDASEHVYSLDKKSLKSLRHEDHSLMPAYGADVMSEADLQDVVAYLQSLRAPSPAAEKGAKHAPQ